MTFEQIGLIAPILKALQAEGYTRPTPIQQQAIPHLLQGKDLLGCAQTGTGKTAAFAIPILQQLYAAGPAQKNNQIKALILTPTRELAIQIDESIGAYGRHTGLRHTVIFGGVGQQPQTERLARGVDILTATPGRLLDLIHQGYVNLKHLKTFVLDEADRMLDMGFVHDVRKVIAQLPEKRQTLLFSATMPPEIQKLAQTILRNPVKVEVTPVSSTAETVDQCLYFAEKSDKPALLLQLLEDQDIRSILIFTRTKHGADRVAKSLNRAGIRADAIHGNKSQSARQTALGNFKKGLSRALVATDIAARGIDIDDLAWVLNYEMPNIPETYVHRIGRTGRAGAGGQAVSFCDTEERAYLKDIEKLIGRKVAVIPTPALKAVPASEAPATKPATQSAAKQASRPAARQTSSAPQAPRAQASEKKQEPAQKTPGKDKRRRNRRRGRGWGQARERSEV